MQERNLDFDRIVDRRQTDSLKYDFAARRGKPENILPLWVADMDFPTSSLVLDAVTERTAHGIFGYTETGERYFEAVAGWMWERHHWHVKSKWLVKTPGVVFALAMAVKAYTEKGDGVLIQQPVYYPFSEVIRENQRVVVSNDLALGADGKYRIDFQDFERKIEEYRIRLFLLCSPHNPVGRVWSAQELTEMGEICRRHQVIVVSDEIHEDFVFGENHHQVFANLKEEFADISITCTSPGKTFNLAGLQTSNIFIPSTGLRNQFQKQIAAAGYSQLNTLGLTACEAAYRYGGIWYDALLDYLAGNLLFVKDYLNRKLPEIRLTELEGTYLLWLDFRGLGLTEAERERLIVKKAGLWLDSGAMFGSAGEGFERLNMACPRRTLEEALDRLRRAIREK